MIAHNAQFEFIKLKTNSKTKQFNTSNRTHSSIRSDSPQLLDNRTPVISPTRRFNHQLSFFPQNVAKLGADETFRAPYEPLQGVFLHGIPVGVLKCLCDFLFDFVFGDVGPI